MLGLFIVTLMMMWISLHVEKDEMDIPKRIPEKMSMLSTRRS